MKLTLKNVRLSFPDIFEPRAFKPGDPLKYKATFLLEKSDPQIKAIDAAILSALTDKVGTKAAATLKNIKGNPNKYCFQDGDAKEYDGYAGHMALTANSKARPLVLDRDKTPLTQSDGKPYAGCYVNASVEVFAYDNSGVGVSATLKGVQFVKDGDAFGGGAPASPDDFDDLGVEEEAGADDLLG